MAKTSKDEKTEDATKILMTQHREVEAFFEELEDGNPKMSTMKKLANSLALHMTLEERIFYPASNEDETEGQLREGVEEHLAAKRTLADLLAMKPKDPQFRAKVAVLKEQVLHHVKEEEKELFPKVRKLLGKERLAELGDEMRMLASKLGRTKKNVGKQLSSQTDHAASL
ncbi:MAG: hemerythrin domain-containing protein [Myxococcales bacterium]|nr:hemerythrin domain-containing protein [Myxococcales bacterium]